MRKVTYLVFLPVLMAVSSANFKASAQTKWVAPTSADKLKNPAVGDAAALKDAKTVYKFNMPAVIPFVKRKNYFYIAPVLVAF